MAAFVLVHGSGQNATCWSRVGALLQARGHDVVAPDLPKHRADWTLDDYARRIADSVQGPHAIVVAHSFSGTFLPLVPRHRDCGLLVFLAAVIPEPGRSVRDQFEADPTMFDPGWIAAGARWFDPAQQAALARHFLFHDCDEDALQHSLATLEVCETRHVVTEPCPLTAWPDVPAAAIVAAGDRTLSPAWCAQRSREALQRDATVLDTGHCPQDSQPQRLAEVLEQLAARVRR